MLIERVWRSLKYEEVYLTSYDSMAVARQQIGAYFGFLQSKTSASEPWLSNPRYGLLRSFGT